MLELSKTTVAAFVGLLLLVVIVAHSLSIAENNAQRAAAADLAQRRAHAPYIYILSPPGDDTHADRSLHSNETCVGGYVVIHTAIGDVRQRSEEMNRGQLLNCKNGLLLSPR